MHLRAYSLLTLLLATAFAFAACGGTSDTDQIQATQRAYLEALQADDAGDACRLTTDHQRCLEAIATAHALGIKPSDTLAGDEERTIETMTITVTGDHAVSARGNEFVKDDDGAWLMVWKNDS